jgi:hypothetical protein
MFMPMAMKPAVSPVSSAAGQPRPISFQPPTSHSIESAISVVTTGMYCAK